MSDPYIGEIRMFGGNFAPVGWNLCDGSLLSISEYEPLYNLIGTSFGGDGATTFGVPDLRGRIPIHFSSSYPIGQRSGSETVTLTTSSIPAHNHPMMASGNPETAPTPTNNALGVTPTGPYNYLYTAISASPQQLDPAAIPSSGGGGQPHGNVQPFQCVTFIIAYDGIFPSQS